MTLVNTELLRRPSNWMILATMVTLALFALHYGLGLIHGMNSLGLSEKIKHPSRIN